MRKRNVKLKQRVEDSRSELKDLDIKSAKHYFTIKYPIYSGEKNEEKLNNLWYCRSFDEDFTKHLESFVKFKEVQRT